MSLQNSLPGIDGKENVEKMTFDLPQPEPIKGFPELRWTGKRPFTSTHYYPAQLKERYGDPMDGWMNRIYWGDNLQVMSHLLKEFRGKVDLVYIDPPFDSKADYKKRISLKGNSTTSDTSSFEEKQYTDIWSNDEYLQFMYDRIIIIKELLSDMGSILLHCDWHKSHHLRCILEEIFGAKNTINEVVWQRFNFRADGKKFGCVHDTILFYSKTRDYIYNQQYWKLKDDYIKSHFRTDKNGRLYRLDNLSAPLHGSKAIPLFFGDKLIDPPVGTMWRYSQENITKLFQEGRIVLSESNNVPQIIRYLDEIPGQAMHSIWTDNRNINSQASERENYPTQKPETLLERIVRTSSNPGSLVLDCFMGSGTTQAVAMKLGRRFIGADINLGAIQTTTKRLNGIIAEKKKESKSLLDNGSKPYLNFEVYNVNNYDVFRNPVQARDLLLQALEIEPLESTSVFDGMKDGYKVKIMPVNRIATREDLNPILTGINYRELDRNMEAAPGSPAARIMLICMGHEPDLAARLKMDIGSQYRVDVKVVDILRDRKDLTFKYDSEAEVAVEKGELVIRQFYPRNLLQKLSILEENVEDWRQLVETVAIDWNYNGEVLQPAVYDNPGKNDLVRGRYAIPGDYGIIRVKITDLLSESLEMTLEVE